jgi:hypothetical protein
LKNESPTERQILDYLAANPAARDTLRGIAEWWLLKQRIVETTSDVESALANLVASGKLSVQEGPDGQIYYGCPQGKAQQTRNC